MDGMKWGGVDGEIGSLVAGGEGGEEDGEGRSIGAGQG